MPSTRRREAAAQTGEDRRDERGPKISAAFVSSLLIGLCRRFAAPRRMRTSVNSVSPFLCVKPLLR